MNKPIKITKAEADKLIAEINLDDNSTKAVIKLGKFHYDVSDCTEKELIDYMYEHNRRFINKPEFGATRV